MNEDKPLIYTSVGRAADPVFGGALRNISANFDLLQDSWEVLNNIFPGQTDYLRVQLEIRRLDIEYLSQDPLRFPWFWRPVSELEIRSGETEEWCKNVLVVTLPSKANFQRFYLGDLGGTEVSYSLEWNIVKALLTYHYMHLPPEQLRQTLDAYKKLDQVRELPNNEDEIADLLTSIENFLGDTQ